VIKSKPMPPYRLTDPEPIPPRIRKAAERNFNMALDRRAPLGARIKRFLLGESKLGRTFGAVADIAMIFLPGGVRSGREAVQKILNRQTKYRPMPERVKPYLKQKSTWEGIAAVAAAIGLFISPEGAVMIVTGLLTTYGGIKLWKKEAEDQK